MPINPGDRTLRQSDVDAQQAPRQSPGSTNPPSPADAPRAAVRTSGSDMPARAGYVAVPDYEDASTAIWELEDFIELAGEEIHQARCAARPPLATLDEGDLAFLRLEILPLIRFLASLLESEEAEDEP